MNPAKITSEVDGKTIEIEVKLRVLSPNLRSLMSRIEAEYQNKIVNTYKELAKEAALADKLTNYLIEHSAEEKEELIAKFNKENNCELEEETQEKSLERADRIAAIGDKKYIVLLNTIVNKASLKAAHVAFLESEYESEFWQNADIKAVYDIVESFRESTQFRR